MKSFKWTSRSAAQTRQIGKKIGRLLESGDVVALSGGLGAGKTTLVKGIATALGVPEKEVASPTYVLIHEYEGTKKIYHLDWYRLERVEGPDRSSAEECFSDDAVTLVEWAERGREILPKSHIRIKMSHAGKNRLVGLELAGHTRPWKISELK